VCFTRPGERGYTGGSVPDFKQPTTAPPPFDPEEFAKSSESALRVASDYRMTTEVCTPPPLNKRVRLAVPEADLAWFEMSPEAKALVGRIDGTQTLMEMMEAVPSPEFLRAVAELHDAKLLAYEEK
jgi:hypothetical protein